MKLKKIALATILGAGTLMSASYAQTEIQWWHSMNGALNDWVNDLAKEFNESQTDYKVVPVFKGDYEQSMTAGIAAIRSGNAPDILQVFEVGTASMIYSKGVTKSVSEIMKENDIPFDINAYIPAVAGYYASPEGDLLSLPFNSSTTVMYYNKDEFKKAGLDPDKAPKTWKEVRAATEALKASGSKCPMTISWMGWTQLESFSAWHNVPYSTKNNGFGGMDAELQFNSPLHVKHFENLSDMAKNGLFVYKGRSVASQPTFLSGECAIFMGSSGFYSGLKRDAKFDFAETTLPYYDDVEGAPQNTVIGGASLWVLNGKPAENYKGVAKFFEFISQPERAAQSHMRTGYLPITKEAFEITEKTGFYNENPGADVPVQQMIRDTNDNTRGLRLGNMLQIRTIVDEETEQVWTGKKSPKDALDSAVERGNALLKRFERVNK
ncbi:sn-glycerol-3-phosphate ABC transporter substrate-binding protein UgpB [Wohlfahrtiimonas populi]|uniref:sn-glycerol-3-phosphate ABC transporter substrate-binding protein UgpB n=1 Tax=Wohlfahrtiimonas populi TaxID=1940240 RepID=UPI00098D046A|nr:sn-glycerol-3-phosphate ABC transporter substrate-binding protein UgpB [Wohlfahrtiimonas populi]